MCPGNGKVGAAAEAGSRLHGSAAGLNSPTVERPTRGQNLSAEDFRRAAFSNGYALLRVKSRGKRPVAENWLQGELLGQLLPVSAAAANTGICTSGLRVIDVDVDEPTKVQDFLKAVTPILPTGGLIRRRPGSPRLALVFRAAEGKPCKLVVGGRHGKIEVLGKGQQLVAHGVHETGGELFWLAGRSPATVPVANLPSMTEEQIAKVLSASRAIVGLPVESQSVKDLFPPRSFNTSEVTGQSDLAAGISIHHPFDDLAPDHQRSVVAECLTALDNSTSDPRNQWLAVLFAVADAGQRGCPNVRSLALEWSRRGAGWTSEADFDSAWDSYRANRAGGTTVGTLFHLARSAGVEISSLLDPSPPEQKPTDEIPVGALPVASLPAIPPKRQWLHGIDLVRGAVSLIVAPGGKGKSSFLTSLALACASGRPLLDSHVFGGKLRVLHINAEDATDEIALRVRAAMAHHQLTDTDVGGLYVAGADRLSLTLIKVERGTPALNPPGWQELRALVSLQKPDVLILDPLVAVVGGATLNDNAAAALLMRELVALASRHKLAVIIAHHTSKNRELGNADAAMGAASIVNLARISLAIEPLRNDDATKIGVAPWDVASIFRVTGTKQNLSPAAADERWFRLVSVEVPNAQPPIYPHGDKVGVVEVFKPSLTATPFPQAMIDAALVAVGTAPTPLSPSPKSGDYAVPVIARALAPQRNGIASDIEAKAILDYLHRVGRIQIGPVQVNRTGRGGYTRQAYIVVGPVASTVTGSTPPTSAAPTANRSSQIAPNRKQSGKP
ncbi:AAA family ATPase [Mesorhizobium sp. ESP7-2]|uniref:AAA family ATPase n=1 Tax=Mesorhizobium sp. ESP7-2 TaxID=2876622 RepID=UPI001CCE79AA|nr:AAA family ATPase [Mesorhizobium sp. ESP7-2]MBZ9706962.1 AAA family ATPase [Mesorhizobium sp. ESP7-2]